jgi:hypothetical protein
MLSGEATHTNLTVFVFQTSLGKPIIANNSNPGKNPSILQTTVASLRPNVESQTVRHLPLCMTSTRPSHGPPPFTRRTSVGTVNRFL